MTHVVTYADDVAHAASFYASLGWIPTPLRAGEKWPPFRYAHTTREQWLRSNSPEVVRQVFEDHYGSGHGVGVFAGWSGLVALDIDGPEGEESLDRLEGDHGTLPATVEAHTGRADGGRQLLYSRPLDLQLKHEAGAFGANYPSVDVRSANRGVVVLPPTVHRSGRSYEWVRPPAVGLTNLSSLPLAWVLALLRLDPSKLSRPSRASVRPRTASDPGGTATTVSMLDEAIDAVPDPYARKVLGSCCERILKARQGKRRRTVYTVAERIGGLLPEWSNPWTGCDVSEVLVIDVLTLAGMLSPGDGSHPVEERQAESAARDGITAGISEAYKPYLRSPGASRRP